MKHYTTLNGRTYDVIDYIPEGWIIKDAPCHPKGMIWICNNKSIFSPDYILALIVSEQ